MSPASTTETILVVDDETLVRSLSHSMLIRYGYNVITAASGIEAVQLFEKWPDVEIDLALVDLVMPFMNGVETVQRIRRVRPQLPVIFISAYSDNVTLRPESA